MESVQRFYKARLLVKSRNLEILLHDLYRDPYFNQYLLMMINIYEVYHDSLHKELTKRYIVNTISICHMKASESPRDYIIKVYSQMMSVARMYVHKRYRDPHFASDYAKRLKSELGGRHCIENLIEGLTVALEKPQFTWRGRNVTLELGNNTSYNAFIMSVIQNYQKNANKNLPLLLARRKKVFWGKIKNKPIQVGSVQVPMKVFNKGGKRFTKLPSSNLLNYINVNVNNRKKVIVNRLERKYILKRSLLKFRNALQKEHVTLAVKLVDNIIDRKYKDMIAQVTHIANEYRKLYNQSAYMLRLKKSLVGIPFTFSNFPKIISLMKESLLRRQSQ
jgi:hypothetical protein